MTPIDFNEAGPQLVPGQERESTRGPQFDFAAIKAGLQDHLGWVEDLYPRGRRSPDKRYWCLANWDGEAPRGEGSCRIDLMGDRAGWGCDFSTGEGYDPIGAIGRATGLTGAELFAEAARLARVGVEDLRPLRPAPKKRDKSLDVAHILSGVEPLPGSLGAHYLSTRGLEAPDGPDLLYHPDLTDFETKRGYCGLVAIVRDGSGEKTGGIHRTFLLDDGSAKAAPGKKMLGPTKHGAVRLEPVGDDGHLGIAEGIETALSASSIFGVPCWAALSAGALREWEWPAGVQRVSIFSDAGSAGLEAAQALAERLTAAGIPFEIRTPLHGDDFNDDHRRGATFDDYPTPALPAPIAEPAIEPPAGPAPAPPLATFDQIEAACRMLGKGAELAELSRIIGAIVRARLEPIPEDHLLSIIKRNSGANLAKLREQVKVLKRRFGAGGDPDVEPIKPPWAGQLKCDLLGSPERNERNVMIPIMNDEAFAGAIVFDEFRQETMVTRQLPWDAGPGMMPRPWRETDDINCAMWLQQRDVNVPPAVVSRAVQSVARAATVHPVRDYLNSLVWDGRERLERWPVTYLGADDSRLNCAFGALWCISAVARIFDPGCKADHMLILEGPQGGRKSSALKVMAGSQWFTDELADVGSKDAAQQVAGVWIIELAELDAIGRADVGRIKAFLSRTSDRYRPAYGRYVIDVPRQCVFAGSDNRNTYLRDETGNRRFWPVRCGVIDIESLARDRDQLWAEAVARYRAGAVWWLTDNDLVAAAQSQQEDRYQGDAWDERIDRWLKFDPTVQLAFPNAPPVARRTPLVDVSVSEILEKAIGLETGRWSRADQMRIAAYLKHSGWERYRVSVGERSWRYRRSVQT